MSQLIMFLTFQHLLYFHGLRFFGLISSFLFIFEFLSLVFFVNSSSLDYYCMLSFCRLVSGIIFVLFELFLCLVSVLSCCQVPVFVLDVCFPV